MYWQAVHQPNQRSTLHLVINSELEAIQIHNIDVHI
jgi:hypothetical protein